MRHYLQHCTHCGTTYSYQASGGGAPKYNHQHWCQDCAQVALEALAKVPVRFERRSQPLQEIPRFQGITKERMLSWEALDEANREALRAEGRIVARRIGVGLFNLNNGDHQRVRVVNGHEEFQGHHFWFATWDKSPDDYEMSINMEYDLQEGRFTGNVWRD